MGDVGTTSAVYAARPRIRLDGRFDPVLSEGLLSFMVEETTAGLYRAEANFGNWGSVGTEVDYLYLDRQVLDFGKALSIQAGDTSTEGRIFEGRITGLEGHYPVARPPELTVLAEDRFQDLRMTRRTRTFEEMSDRDVMNQIAAQHGLRPDIEVNSPAYRVMVQVNQSDLAFLRERAHAVDAELWITDQTLHVRPRPQRAEERLTLTYGQGLKSFSVLADVARLRTRVAVNGWDVSGKEGVEFEATDAAISNEVGGLDSGVSILQQAFGARTERVVHMVPFNNQEARYFAEAHYRHMARGFVRGRGVAEGDGRLRVGTPVTLNGLGGLFGGTYTLTEVRHLFDLRQGYLTHFTAERPGLAAA